ncbi:MAG: excinuclease ABC subunit UvrC [Acidobacteriota bacterium]|nr:excinuclease ABC subunit UvrC [Acidobacteriota bacterium]MDH3523689.1 excinuclease ABC subunit UvrC [Acidobacteriota bacterium]
MHPEVAEQQRRLPDRPGIYIFRDDAGKALYVGKAKSLRKRVASYRSRAGDLRLATMVAEATALEFVVTGSEAEALLLENNWIKSHKPRYNVLLRDDKTYPYVKLTLRDGYPRVAFTRRIYADGAEYYGPFLPGGLARRAIKLTQKLFGIRICTIEIDGSLPRPCLYYDMKRCLGPCVDGLTSPEAYAGAVEAARLFLNGRTVELGRRLKHDMHEAAEALEYERAAALRDLLAEIDSVTQRRSLSSLGGEDVDIYGVHLAGGNAAVTILVMRGGRVLDRRELFWERRPDLTAQRLLSELLPQVYDRTTFIPKEIHLPEAIDGDEALVEWLSERKGERVYLRLPARGPKAQRLRVARRNAELAHRRRFRADSGAERAAAALAGHLALAEPPARIEGIDISNLQGTEMVGSLVVWEGGRILKKDYRSFNLQNMAGQDDFAAIHQVVKRRYRRVLDEVGSMPDLILVDGGRGQLNAALEALAELGVEETPVAGLAKREEEIYLPATPEPLRLERDDPGLLLLQRIRDEAHRFAVDRHRRRRSKRALGSRLDDLPGIGSHRRKALLQRFGSLEGVRQATLGELQDAVGPLLGQRIHAALRAAGGAPETD